MVRSKEQTEWFQAIDDMGEILTRMEHGILLNNKRLKEIWRLLDDLRIEVDRA